MTKVFEFRILEETKRGRKTALNHEGAASMLAHHESLPSKGIIQVRDPLTGEQRSFRLEGGQLVRDL